jgi:hypothetical protein
MIPPNGHSGKPLGLGLHPHGAHKSLDQSQHPSPCHSIKSVYDVVPVRHGQQALHGSRCGALPGLDVFTEDAPGVLNGA